MLFLYRQPIVHLQTAIPRGEHKAVTCQAGQPDGSGLLDGALCDEGWYQASYAKTEILTALLSKSSRAQKGQQHQQQQHFLHSFLNLSPAPPHQQDHPSAGFGNFP